MAVKFCHMVKSMFSFTIPLKKIWGLPRKIWGGGKNMLNLAWFCMTSDFVWPLISPGLIDIQNFNKLSYQPQFLLHWTKKSGELWSTDQSIHAVNVYSTKQTFRKTIFRFLRCCAPKFVHALETDQVLLAHTAPEMGASSTIFFTNEGQRLP